MTCEHEGWIKLKDDRSEGIDVNLMHSDIPMGKISAQPHTTLCIQFLNRENNDRNNTFPLRKQIYFTIVWGCAETLPSNGQFFFEKLELCEKSDRMQIAVSEKNAKKIRKMCVQKKKKNVIRNVKGKKSLCGNVAVTITMVVLQCKGLLFFSNNYPPFSQHE